MHIDLLVIDILKIHQGAMFMDQTQDFGLRYQIASNMTTLIVHLFAKLCAMAGDDISLLLSKTSLRRNKKNSDQ